jgi:glucose-1-phosphate adenylyltransferase
MGVYVFRTSFLIEQLRRDAATPGSSRDFGKDIIPYLVKNGKAWRIASRNPASARRARKTPIGVMWERSMPIGPQIST